MLVLFLVQECYHVREQDFMSYLKTCQTFNCRFVNHNSTSLLAEENAKPGNSVFEECLAHQVVRVLEQTLNCILNHLRQSVQLSFVAGSIALSQCCHWMLLTLLQKPGFSFKLNFQPKNRESMVYVI
jgi:hypothetical protein